MAAKSSKRQDLEVHLGSSGQIVGRLHRGSGKRSAFSYDERWSRDARFFTLSPERRFPTPPDTLSLRIVAVVAFSGCEDPSQYSIRSSVRIRTFRAGCWPGGRTTYAPAGGGGWRVMTGMSAPEATYSSVSQSGR